jgi:hypothetical protein
MCALKRAASTDGTREALARLPLLSIEDLRAEWNRLYERTAPTRISRELLMLAIAYRIQERTFGGLGPEVLRQLRQIAASIRERGDVVIARTPCLKPGTRLLRDWHRRSHEVLVLDDGFSWQGNRYRSLSQIARAITGTRWSGPAFFGIKARTSDSSRRKRKGEALGYRDVAV